MKVLSVQSFRQEVGVERFLCRKRSQIRQQEVARKLVTKTTSDFLPQKLRRAFGIA